MLATLTVASSCTLPTTQKPTNTGSTVETGSITPVEVNTGNIDPVQTGTTVAPQAFTRTEVVSYKSPADEKDLVEFSVTVTDGVITAASATPKSEHEISQKMQTGFAGEVSKKVVGMKAKNLDVDAIGGASLTTAAFEQFVRSF